MGTSTHSLVSIMEKTFQNDEIKQRCQEKIRKGLINRLFDDFPSLMSPEALKELCRKFKIIVEKIPPSTSDDPIQFLKREQKKQIQEWITLIIVKGCQELLDENNQLNKKIISLLDCPGEPLDVRDLICAYVGAINQVLNTNPAHENLLHQNLSLYTGICLYVNSNYGKWVVDELNKRGFKYDEDKCSFEKLLNIPKDHPEITAAVGIGLGAALLAGATALAVTFFAQPASAKAPTKLKDLPQSPIHRL